MIQPFSQAERESLVNTAIQSTAPHRKFWRDGDTLQVRSHPRKGEVFVFAGLFVYSKMGVGAYHSKVQNEVLFISKDEALAQAHCEGLPFVYFDHMCWTGDPDLTRECQEAHRIFAERNPGKVPAVGSAED
jgi:hypothetical protein